MAIFHKHIFIFIFVSKPGCIGVESGEFYRCDVKIISSFLVTRVLRFLIMV